MLERESLQHCVDAGARLFFLAIVEPRERLVALVVGLALVELRMSPSASATSSAAFLVDALQRLCGTRHTLVEATSA